MNGIDHLGFTDVVPRLLGLLDNPGSGSPSSPPHTAEVQLAAGEAASRRRVHLGIAQGGRSSKVWKRVASSLKASKHSRSDRSDGREGDYWSMDETELDVAESVANVLCVVGSVTLQYLTAEFEPYSSAHRPDIVFIPSDGPNRDRVFVVEVRVTKPSYRPNVRALISHREFVLAELGGYHFFGVATSADLSDADIAALAIDGVHAMCNISSADEITAAIRDWSKSALTPPWTGE